MGNIKRPIWWRRRHSLKPGEAALLGVGIGCVVALISAFTPPSDFTLGFLLLLLLSLGPFGGILGYMLWLAFDPVREQRTRRIGTLVFLTTIVGLLVAFPAFWREIGRSMGPRMVGMFIGFIYSAVMIIVAAGMGIVHLVGGLASSIGQSAKPGTVPRTDGVWDRELDQN
jgi:hypothetical protein